MKNSAVLTALGTPSEFRALSIAETEEFVAAYTQYQRRNDVFYVIHDLYSTAAHRIIFLFGLDKRTKPRDANEKITGLLVYDMNMNLLPYNFGMGYWDDQFKAHEMSRLDWIYQQAYETLACENADEFREEDPWKQYQAMAEAAETMLHDEDTLHTRLNAYRDQTEYAWDQNWVPYNGDLFVRVPR